MKKSMKEILLFNTSLIQDLKSIRTQIINENRKFAVRWLIVEFLYGAFCLFMSFYVERFTLCRNAYIVVMAISLLAFFYTKLLARKNPLHIYLSMLLSYIGLFGVGLMIARILLKNGFSGTIMVFASGLIAPIMFVSNLLLNILVALLYILSAVLFMKGLPVDIYNWCITNVAIFSSMGVTIGYFINTTRFERYVFAESASKLAESNAKVAALQKKYAYYDPMTGLLNRRAYSEKLEQYEKEIPADCCVVMVDINGLKKMNDTKGHAAGDELIIGTAECLRSCFGENEMIYRIGGDEFCVLMNGTKDEVSECLTKLNEACTDWKGKYVDGISVSYGFSAVEEFLDIESLLKAADERMYALKNEHYKLIADA